MAVDAAPSTVPRVRQATREQDVVRLLFILNAAGGSPHQGSPDGSAAVIIGQARLQALDFWMRNPDYLADELLNEFEGGRMGREAIDLAVDILDSDEPDVRRFPMVRWLFGAYEPLDNALAVLRANGLIAVRRVGSPARITRHNYYLLHDGRVALERLLENAPAFTWYAERAALVARVAQSRGGRALKQRQYEQAEYAATELGSRICPIVERVRTRAEALRIRE